MLLLTHQISKGVVIYMNAKLVVERLEKLELKNKDIKSLINRGGGSYNYDNYSISNISKVMINTIEVEEFNRLLIDEVLNLVIDKMKNSELMCILEHNYRFVNEFNYFGLDLNDFENKIPNEENTIKIIRRIIKNKSSDIVMTMFKYGPVLKCSYTTKYGYYILNNLDKYLPLLSDKDKQYICEHIILQQTDEVLKKCHVLDQILSSTKVKKSKTDNIRNACLQLIIRIDSENNKDLVDKLRILGGL